MVGGNGFVYGDQPLALIWFALRHLYIAAGRALGGHACQPLLNYFLQLLYSGQVRKLTLFPAIQKLLSVQVDLKTAFADGADGQGYLSSNVLQNSAAIQAAVGKCPHLRQYLIST